MQNKSFSLLGSILLLTVGMGVGFFLGQNYTNQQIFKSQSVPVTGQSTTSLPSRQEATPQEQKREQKDAVQEIEQEELNKLLRNISQAIHKYQELIGPARKEIRLTEELQVNIRTPDGDYDFTIGLTPELYEKHKNIVDCILKKLQELRNLNDFVYVRMLNNQIVFIAYNDQQEVTQDVLSCR